MKRKFFDSRWYLIILSILTLLSISLQLKYVLIIILAFLFLIQMIVFKDTVYSIPILFNLMILSFEGTPITQMQLYVIITFILIIVGVIIHLIRYPIQKKWGNSDGYFSL